MSNTPNFLFFSNSCQPSVMLINELKNGRGINGIQFCDVSNPNIKIPPFISSTPTLYISIERKILKDQELFNWAKGINSQQEQYQQPQEQYQQQQYQQQQQQPQPTNSVIRNVEITGDDNISAYQAGEFGNFSDTYAFIGEGNDDAITQQSFEFLDGQNASVPGYTKSNEMMQQQQSGVNSIDPKSFNSGMSQGGGGGRRESEKKLSMDKAYEKMMAARTSTTPQGISGMRQMAENRGPPPPLKC